MSGWRMFGVKITERSREHLVPLVLENKKKMRTRNVDGYFVAFIPGYGDLLGRPDPDLVEILRDVSGKGYYILANDTTDTAAGLVRFRKGEPLVDVTDLVDPEIETDDPDLEMEQTVFDGENSLLPEYQLGAPSRWIVYDLLYYEGFPLVNCW